MLRYIVYSLIPLGVLLAAASAACVIAYLLLMIFGEFWSIDMIISKIAKLLLVLSIFPAMSMLKINAEDMGFAAKKLIIRQFLIGLALGLITLFPVLFAQFQMGINVVDHSQPWDIPWFLKKMSISFLLALLISVAEEPIFRGILLTGLNRKFPVVFAIIISAFYYAMLHFLDSDTKIAYQDLTVFSGFSLLGEALTNVFASQNWGALLSLWLIGIFLGLIRTRFKRSLILCIGCHTAWVWQIKMNKSLLNTDWNAATIDWVSHYDGVVGPLVSSWMAVLIAIYLLYRLATRKSGQN